MILLSQGEAAEPHHDEEPITGYALGYSTLFFPDVGLVIDVY